MRLMAIAIHLLMAILFYMKTLISRADYNSSTWTWGVQLKGSGSSDHIHAAAIAVFACKVATDPARSVI